VAVQALDALLGDARYAPKREVLAARVLALSSHGDHAVRGKSLELLGQLGRDPVETQRALVNGLKDEKPFVRALACHGLQSLGDKASIHPLIELVDDDTPTAADLSLDNPDGGKLRAVYSTGPLGFVQESAINAIHQLSGRAFELAVITPKDPKGGLASQAKAAKQWYQKVKEELPELVTTAPSVATTPASASDKEALGASAAPESAPKTAPAKATLPPKPAPSP
jgi:hypothetical protein